MEEKEKPKNSKLTDEFRKLKIDFDFENDKQLIYSVLFYICGIMVGTSFYKAVTSETLDKILMPKNSTFINLFLSDVCLYLALFLIIVFLGLCLIGYPLINIIPAFLGIEYGMKMAYFLVNYSAKGLGYAVLMVVPFSAAYVTIISYTLRISSKMSKNLIEVTKEGSTSEFNLKPYVKQYAVIGAVIIIMSLISAGVTTLFFGVVTI